MCHLNKETGESCPDILQARALAQTFELSLDEFLENDTTDALLKKVSQSKKISLLSFGISFIHFLLFLMVLCFLLLILFHYFKAKPAWQGVEIQCSLNNQVYYYQLRFDSKKKEIFSFDTNDAWMKEHLQYRSNEAYEDVLDRIRTSVIAKGGNCNGE